MSQPYGEVVLWGADPFTGESFPGERRFPFYGCGHCSRPVVMHPARVRPRKYCSRCSRQVCDNQICDPQSAGCTPLYSLADNHDLSGDNEWNRLVPGIMRGATTVEEALQTQENP